jgi:tRNA nucleotidyltransferase (CCA-adding enzyme)
MKVYLVGGAVRDKLMGLQPKDRDWVVVGATEADVQKMLADGYTQVGADFPVFLHPETNEEYALARVERKNGVGYHGFTVQADASVTIEEDLARRDLTVNSMAMDDDGKIIDPFGGLRDLRNGVLRHTTEAFAEDPLRVLRLARFAARLPAWRVDESTKALCWKLASEGELNHLSIERIWAELEKGFAAKNPGRMLEVLERTGALLFCDTLSAVFGPGLEDSAFKVLNTLAAVPQEKRFAACVGAIALPDSDLPGASARVRECLKNVTALRNAKFTCHDLAEVLKRSRALGEGPAFSDFLSAVVAIESAGTRLPFSMKQLALAAHIMKGVKAIQFPGIVGKALGQAIENQRVQNLQQGLNIPINV